MSESTPNPVKKVIARRTAVVELVVTEYEGAKELRIGAEGEDPAVMIYAIEDHSRSLNPIGCVAFPKATGDLHIETLSGTVGPEFWSTVERAVKGIGR